MMRRPTNDQPRVNPVPPFRLRIAPAILLGLVVFQGNLEARQRPSQDNEEVEERSERLYFEGVAAFGEGEYEQALRKFRQAAELDPSYYLADYYAGVTLGKLGRDREATRYLNRTVDYLNGFPEKRLGYVPAHQDLGIVYYRLRQFDDARTVLSEALDDGRGDIALVHYYLGLTEYQTGRTAEAIRLIQLALQARPELGGEAYYYLGLAYAAQGDFERAIEELELAAASAHVESATAARRLVQQLKIAADGGREKRWEVRLGLGGYFDANVILEPDDFPSFEQITDESDSRLALNAGAGFSLIDSDRGYLDVDYDFYQSLHNRVDAFDLQSHEVRLGGAGEAGRSLRIGAEGGFKAYRLGGDDYLREAYVKPFVGIQPEQRFYTSVFYRFADHNFLVDFFDPIRDGQNHRVGVDQYFLWDGSDGFVWLGYNFRREIPDSAMGRDFEFEAHSLRGGARLWLLPRLNLEATYWYRHEDYRFPNSRDPLGRPREDRVHTVQVKVRRPLNRRLTLEFLYLGRWNQSNLASFEYRRHVAGGSLQVVF